MRLARPREVREETATAVAGYGWRELCEEERCVCVCCVGVGVWVWVHLCVGEKRDSRYRSQICGIGSFGASDSISETVVNL